MFAFLLLKMSFSVLITSFLLSSNQLGFFLDKTQSYSKNKRLYSLYKYSPLFSTEIKD